MAIDKAKLDRALNPRTVAVIGDKASSNFMWLRNMSTVQGKVYSVQINPDDLAGIEAMGISNYTSISDIPDDIDYVLVAVPRAAAPHVLKECIEKGVGGVAMFTSGFAETGTGEGLQLQERITQLAKDAGLILIGPNCMGLFNPKAGVRFSQEQITGISGTITFVSQSGGHAASLTLAAQAQGIGINKVVSFGNGVVLENADYLEYFAQDDETQVIAMYIEGVKDGRRFFHALRETTPRKPVVIWKGGQTEEGKRATSSHTGSLAESADTWDVLIKQCGALRADSLDEMVDVVKALAFMPKFTGQRIGLTGGSGGQSVSMTDAFAKAGLQVPLLATESYERLESFFRLIGASYMNPIDMGGMNRAHVETILGILAGDPNVDVVAMQLTPRALQGNSQEGEGLLDALFNIKEKVNKPFATMLFTSNPYSDGENLKELDRRLQEAGIPSFPTYERAAQAIKKVADYYKFHDGSGG